MREEYKNILDEMVINEDVINDSTDGRRLLMYLQKHKVLRYQEKEEMDKMGPKNSIEHLMTTVLKSRNDKAMKHFLNSLQEANFDDAYSWLQEKLCNSESRKLDNSDSQKLDNSDSQKLDNPDSTVLWKSNPTDITLKTAWGNLKVNYEERLKFVESYWRKFGIEGILNMDTFYNHNIIISNEKYKQIQKKIENFDDMFSSGYKRIIVIAEAGYGKSTFVYEMARQWVKGDKGWTKKFEFLFLFRLTEVNENESKSLENLLTVCLCPHDASQAYNWLKCGNMSKALFVFDGLDKLRQNFCQEVNELIFGGQGNLATIIITSRKCEKLKEIENDKYTKLYIELKGYTNEGVIQQLKKFDIQIDEIKQDLKNHLKIPLFNTIFCLTHSENSLVSTNICSSIHSFVKFAINHQNSNQSFTVFHKQQLMLTLGQAAQYKFSFIKNVEIPYPNISRDHLFWAVNSGLLHHGSHEEDVVFAHQTIAEYCAAYFWCKTSRLAIKERCDSKECRVSLNEPPNAEIDYLESFTQFVCYLCPKFKEDLWRKFVYYVPIFDEYKSLPDRPCPRWIHFSSHSVDDQVTIMNKLHFHKNSEVELYNGQFEPEKLFKTIRKLKYLYLEHCTFNIGAEEFFIHFTNVQSLTFRDCEFNGLNIVYDDPDSDKSNPQCPSHLPLQELKIYGSSVGIETFLSFIMKHSTFMKSFKLIVDLFDDCGTRWISELQNNEQLCISIETCKLKCTTKLTKLEANALADLLEVGLFGLKLICLDIKMENHEDYEPILKNLSKLSALTHLHLRRRPFATRTFRYLADIFNKLKLEECGLEYQEIFFEEQIINSINSCLSLKKITFWMGEMEDSNYELFKKRIKSKDNLLLKFFLPQLEIIEDYISKLFWDI